MADTPNVGAPIWAASEASPWLMSGKRARIFDALVAGVIVTDMSLTAPPVSCADGARFIVHSVATGAWAGHEGQLAIAVGANASNGWYFATVAIEGMLLHNVADGFNYRYHSGAWVRFADAVSRLQDLLDVSLGGLADGFILKWDASNGVFYATAPEVTAVGPDTDITRLQDLLDVDLTGLADGYTLKWDASNGVFYPAPDIAAGGGTGTVTECIIIAASDETTALTTGDKVTFRMPYPFTLTSVKASLTTAQASGSIFTTDLKKGGSTIFSTLPTIDNTEKTTATAATPSVLSTTALADDDEIVVNVNQIGDGTAKGLKIVLIGHQ